MRTTACFTSARYSAVSPFSMRGESREVTLTVPKEELGYWNEEKQMFVVEPGTVKLLIGASSEDIRLEGKIRL